MTTIIVKRGTGSRPGPTITEALCTDDQSKIEAGRYEVDYNCSNRAMVPTTGPFVGWISPGSLVHVTEMDQTWLGMVDRCALNFSIDNSGSFVARTNLELEKES